MVTNLRLGALVVAVVTMAAGCGGGGGDTSAPKASPSPSTSSSAPGPLEGLTGEQILEKALVAARAAGTVHYTGTLVEEGQTLTLDIRASDTGDAEGTVSSSGEGGFDLRRVGGRNYLRGDRAFWRTNVNRQAAAIFAGKWLVDDREQSEFGEAFELLSLDDMLNGVLEPEGALEIVEGRDIDGQPTVGLRDEATDPAEMATLFISEAEEPLPLLLQPDDAEAGSLEFTEWGEPITVEAPRRRDVVDIGELAGG